MYLPRNIRLIQTYNRWQTGILFLLHNNSMDMVGHDHIFINSDTRKMLSDFQQSLFRHFPPPIRHSRFPKKLPHFLRTNRNKEIIRLGIIIVF